MRGPKIIRLVLWMVLLILIQVLVLNHLEINAYIYPQVYILGLLGLPITIDRRLAYIIGFGVGFAVDSFLMKPGLHAATCTLLMFLRQMYFDNFADNEWKEVNLRPGIGSPETSWYVIYVVIASLLFHSVLFMLDAFSFAHFDVTLLRILFSSSISILLILLLEFVTDSPKIVE